MLLTAAGCSDQDASSSTADTDSSVTTAETTSTEVTTTVDIEALMPQEEELDPTLIPFQDIAFQVPAGWGNLSVENLVVWYPNDGSGSLTVQCFPEDELEITGTDEKDLLKNIGQNLAKERTAGNGCLCDYLFSRNGRKCRHRPESESVGFVLCERYAVCHDICKLYRNESGSERFRCDSEHRATSGCI